MSTPAQGEIVPALPTLAIKRNQSSAIRELVSSANNKGIY
jgi:hypothetical protein